MKYFSSLLILFIYINIFSQYKEDIFTKEIGITSENDAYMLAGKDGYYTNGLEFYINWKSKQSRDSLKINTLAIGQSMYNAQNGDYSLIEDMDRPITAYLYVSYKQTHFLHKKEMLRWGVSAAAIGPIAMGKQAQVFLHHILGMYDPKEEWDFQLKNSIGVNGEITWSREVLLKHNWEVQSVVGARVGSFFTNIDMGTLFRWGKYNSNSNTSFWNTRLNSNDKKSRKEFFFYFWPSLSIYAYNATIQGGLFRNEKGAVTGKLNPFLYHQKIGLIKSWDHLSLNLAVNYQTKETSLQEKTQWYGTIDVKYLFK